MIRKSPQNHFTQNEECLDELQRPAMPDLIPSVIVTMS